MFILSFSTVNTHGDLFVISASYISSKNQVSDGGLPPRETAKSLLSCDGPAKEMGFILVIII